ncbi:MAG: hypothetical protein SOX86_02265, partial [Bacilli bacterium]|nr:hypothetical protein [Bacilli bacterium]
ENTINAGKSQVIKTGVVNFTLTESTNGLVLDNLQELTDYEGMAQETFYEFTIKNTGNTITDYEISLVDKPNSSYTGTILNEKYIKVGLLKNNSKEIIVNLKDVNRLIDKVTLDVEDTVNYKLRLWLDFGNLEDEAKEALVGQKIFLALKINGIQNVNKIPTGADTLIKLTDNKDSSGLYTITHPADSTLQIGTNEDITEYRYRGASPKNYVTFNNEVWRILGVFPTDDGTGKIENRIKIIRDQSIGNNRWNSTQVASTSTYNNWTGATLMTYLNSSYINTLDINEAYGLIDNVKYYLGGYNSYTHTSQEMYSYERKISGSGTYFYKTNPNSWLGKAGLMYVSDYGYASANCENKKLNDGSASNDLRACNNTNWLFNIKENEWMLPQTGSGDNVFRLISSGNLNYVSPGSNIYKYAVRPTLYLKSEVQITKGDGTSSNPYKLSFTKNEDTSNANAPVLASNMIPVYYDGTDKVWKKADVKNKAIENRWYNYENHMWANAVTVKDTNRQTYLNANVGTPISMDDITTMWVWIPRFNAVTPSNYNGGTKALPNAIDVTFVKPNETALDAFTFGTKQLSGFWYGKFELSHTTLVSNTTANNLGCINEACANANNILIKPSVTILRYNNISNFFYASRSMEQPNNSFGFVGNQVDTHMSKNNEWGAVAYLTQSIYGRCVNSTLCVEIGINNNSTYKTGYGAPAGTSSTSSTTNTYDTTVGMEASTTGNIYGIYDMAGGLFEYVMGVYNKTTGNSGFTTTTFPNEKYYNNYTATTYQGHALTETQGWYNDIYSFVSSSSPWFVRGATVANVDNNGIFSAYGNDGGSNGYRPTRFTLTNE